MNKIAYAKLNENIFFYIDSNSKLNIMENFNNVEYTQNAEDKITAIGVNTSYNDEYILYYGTENDNDTLSIISYDRLRRGDLQNISFKFETSSILLNTIVSKNKNRVAIIFTLANDYIVLMNGERVRHQEYSEQSRNNYYLHVYDFSDGNSRLIFSKIYIHMIKVALSDIDTISVSLTNDMNHNIFQVYDLNTNNILINNRSLNFFRIFCMHYIPSTPQLPNHLVIVSINSQLENHLRVIDLRRNTFVEIWNNIVPNLITSIDISRNGRIALGGENGVLVYHSFGARASTYFPDFSIDGLSLSPNALYLAVEINYSTQIRLNIPQTVYVLSLQQGVPGVDTIPFMYPREQRIEPSDALPSVPHPINIENRDDVVEVLPIQPLRNIHQLAEPNTEIQDPQLDAFVPNQPTNQQKLQEYGNDNCFDFLLYNEENIGEYLSSDPDNIVFFYKSPSDAGFLATCCTFSRLKKYLKDPTHVFYTCIDKYDYRNYHRIAPEFLKIPTSTHTIFVSYQDMKKKYLQRQNMIFLEHNRKVELTITYDASLNMAFVSSNHCQKGSIIDVYEIIF